MTMRNSEPMHPNQPNRPASDLIDSTASPLTRISLISYVVLIVYASWYPFTGWNSEHLISLPSTLQQWPRYWTGFDASTNVIGYMPLGLLIVFSLYPWRHRLASVVLATLAGFCLSLTAEVVQYFLPSRVCSILDVITNTSGTLLGALIGALLTSAVLRHSRLRLLKRSWLQQESSRQMLALALWALAQIYPQAYLFGLGQITPILSSCLYDWFDIDFDFTSLILHGKILNADHYLLIETIITACGGTGAMLMCLHLLNHRAPKARLTIALFVAALSAKTLASAILFTPEHAFDWLTPGAQGGILISAIMAYGFAFTPSNIQKRLAILMLSISLLLVNFIPSNPYFAETLQGWVQGKFLNFNGAAQFLSLLWPFLAFWYLIDNAPQQFDRRSR